MAFKRSAVRSRLSPPGRLAQLVAHPLDVREVTSSSLVSSTTETTGFPVVSSFFCTFCPLDRSSEFCAYARLHVRTLELLSSSLSSNMADHGIKWHAITHRTTHHFSVGDLCHDLLVVVLDHGLIFDDILHCGLDFLVSEQHGHFLHRHAMLVQ